MEYDFGQVRYITKVKIQGRPSTNQWVTSYHVKVWHNEEWITISDDDEEPIVRL